MKREVIISRIRSGHVRSLENLHRLNTVDSPLCNCGEAVQDWNHMFFFCSDISEDIADLRVRLWEHDQNITFDTTSIAFSDKPGVFKCLFEFARANGITI